MTATADLSKLKRIHTLLKAIVTSEGHQSGSALYRLLGRASGIMGSWQQLKPGTVENFIAECVDVVKNRHKYQQPEKATPNYTRHYSGIPAGFEKNGEGKFQPETVDVKVSRVLKIRGKAKLVVIYGRNYWLPDSLVTETLTHDTKDEFVSVPLWWVREVKLAAYL